MSSTTRSAWRIRVIALATDVPNLSAKPSLSQVSDIFVGNFFSATETPFASLALAPNGYEAGSVGLVSRGRGGRPRSRGGTWGRHRSSRGAAAPEPGRARPRRARRGGAHQDPAVGVLDQLDETVITRLVDPAPGGTGNLGTAHPNRYAPLRRLGLGEADRADLRVGEGDPGHGVILGGGDLLAEDARHHDVRLVHRHVRERAVAGDVADRKSVV